MNNELVELMGKGHPLRVLLWLRARGPQRFGEMEKALGMNPTQLDRSLKWLHARLYVLPSTGPSKGRGIPVTYALSKRGRAFLEAFDSFVAKADERRAILGEKSVDELHALVG